ncbi:tyrosine-type recombinase/integrase [Azospirillum baldaniorum]|uniref:tyrosine-type recombinase/integrase n=1 Tax=Azospirillum baldaniorum TaxID=1064539 RepID=UPI0011A231EB|nr:tyrosine-type recombinase/integrase [Azospirillum baldaniorum]
MPRPVRQHDPVPRPIRLPAEGCRQEEVAGLTWKLVNRKAETVTFLKTKTSRLRTIRLDPDTLTMLTALPHFLGSDAVFWHGKGARYLNVSSRFREMVRSAQRVGTPFRPFRCHDLRHGFAIRSLQNGWDIYALPKHLRHSSVRTTEIYLGYVPARAGTKTGTSITVSPG